MAGGACKSLIERCLRLGSGRMEWDAGGPQVCDAEKNYRAGCKIFSVRTYLL
jgi:hypothetical protein